MSLWGPLSAGSLVRVLVASPKQTPDPPAPMRRVDTTEKRSAKAKRRLIVGGIALLLVIAGVVWALTRPEGESFIPFVGSNEPKIPTPPFAFKIKQVKANTTTDAGPSKVIRVAKDAAGQVKSQLDILYYDAFVDPKHWDGDDYDDVWDLFDSGAKDQAESDIQTLTLGEGAGDVYDFVQPHKGGLTIHVLTDASNQPAEALAQVTFTAVATLDDGTYTKIVSTGHYFLKPVDGQWRIYSYDIKRQERKAEPPKSKASDSTSPTAVAS
jgi:hypothetical protein